MSDRADREPLRGIDRRSFIAGSAALGILAAVPGCSRRSSSSDSSSSDAASDLDFAENETIHVYLSNPACIDPFNAYESNGIQVCRLLFDPLVTYDYEAGNLMGCAAEAWDASDDGRVFTFHLTPGGTFSDGTSVRAEDFKYAWERIANPMTDPSSRSHLAYLIEGIRGCQSFIGQKSNGIAGIVAVDDLTLTVTLDEPFYDFPYVASHPALAPVSKEAASDPIRFAIDPQGNGAFSMAEPWADGQYIKLIANDLYRDDVPAIGMIDFKIFKDEQTAYLEYEAGNLDFCAVPASDITTVSSSMTASDDGYTASQDYPFIDGGESATFYLILNCNDQSIASPDLRRAISLAIDRETICKSVFSDMYLPATGIVPPGVRDYRENAWDCCVYDKDAAASALADAGFPKGQDAPTLSFLVSSADYEEDVMDLVASDLQAIGLTVNIAVETPDDYIDDIENGNYQIAHSSWVMDYPLSDDILCALCSSSSPYNRSSYRSADFDDALRAARATGDADERTSAYVDLDGRVASDLPIIPIFFYRHHHVVSSKVDQLFYSPVSIADLQHATLIG